MPEVELPAVIELTLDEAAELLIALDRSVELSVVGSADQQRFRRQVRMVTGKLWPDLGQLLDEDEE